MSKKISQLTSAVDVTANDLIQIVDVEDGVMAPSGTNKKATASLLANKLVPLINAGAIDGSKISNSSITPAKLSTGGPSWDSSGHLSVARVSVNNPSGDSAIEIGGSGQVYIDLKKPNSDDYDFRIATDSTLASIETGSGQNLALLTNGGNVGIGTNGPSYQLQLSTDSAAKPSTSTWTVSSDERLKENIEAADLDICYNAVKSIPLKRYKWKDEIYSAEQVTDRSKIGWIAQDVQAVFPKAVGQHKFVYNQVKDEEGNVVSEDSIDDCLSLNSDQLYAALFGAVQKLMGEVESLQDRIAELESAP